MKDFSIQLNNGVEIYLQELRQSRTYEGLLEGLPTKERNESFIQRTLEKAVLPYWKGAPYLIESQETPLQYRDGQKYPFGTPAALPAILCEARFNSLFPARDKNLDFSWLIIVWFQDDFALPIDTEIETHIKSLYWHNIAHDADY